MTDDVSFVSVMYKDDTMSEKAKKLARKFKRRIRHQQLYQEVSEITPLLSRVSEIKRGKMMNPELSEPFTKLDDDSGVDNCATNPWKVPVDSNLIMFFLRWPITFTLWCTIPDSKRFKSFYLLTFINCVLWIGCISYFVVYISTNVGEFLSLRNYFWLLMNLLSVLDSVMGLTFLAAGTSLPEAVSSVIVTAQGYGSMGISNSIGSNTFDILLCLGLPWFIKTLIVPTISGQPWVR